MIKKFILEADPSKIINSQQNSQAVKEMLKRFIQKIDSEEMTERFISWFAQQLRKAEKNNENLFELSNTIINSINRAARMLPPKHIKKINPFQLKSSEQLDSLVNDLDSSYLRAESVSDNGDLEKIFENDEVLVINVKTFEGSYYLSQGEDKWCTSKWENYFDEYKKQGPIFRIYVKTPGISQKYKRLSLSTNNETTDFYHYENIIFNPVAQQVLTRSTYDKILEIYDDEFENGDYENADERHERKYDAAADYASEECYQELVSLIKKYSDSVELQKLNFPAVYSAVMKALGPLGHDSPEWWTKFEYEDNYDDTYLPIYEEYGENEEALKIIRRELYELGCLKDDLKDEFIEQGIYPKDPNQLDLFTSEQFKIILNRFI